MNTQNKQAYEAAIQKVVIDVYGKLLRDIYSNLPDVFPKPFDWKSYFASK